MEGTKMYLQYTKLHKTRNKKVLDNQDYIK